MKAIFLLLAVVACASALTDWEEYKEKFDKQYSGREDARRYKIFTQNKALIEEHNKKFDEGKVTFKMGINKFADMTTEDTSFLRGYKGLAEIKGATVYQPKEVTVTAGDLDWRDYNYVTGVKDQGQCGSCWAFSATGGLEGQHAKYTGYLPSLSEQNLVDCDKVSFGCAGGYTSAAFDYIRETGGIDSEDSYPYEAVDNTCRYNPDYIEATCAGYVVIQQGNEADLLSALQSEGPISIAIDASHDSFQLYSSGIYYEPDCSPTALDHGVLIVGYGTDGGDYWLVKNSWGAGWGEAGYIQMSRNANNNCGVATQALFPLV